MYDVNTDEKTCCPHCGSNEGCQYLLVLFDITFGECIGAYASNRYGELEGVIEDIPKFL
jgi:hypothetical protein